MKKLAFLTALLLAVVVRSYGQSIIIHFNNGTTKVYSTGDISKITVSETEVGYIKGRWHLGWYVSGNTKIHFDGSEYMEFSGLSMTWAGRQDGSGEYAINYVDDNQSFTATNVANASDVSTWTIEEYTDKVLVLRSNNVKRYFYPSQAEAINALLPLNPPSHTETADINTILTYAVGFTKSTVTPMGTHYQNKPAATDADKEWLLNPANEPNNLPAAGLTQWLAQTVTLYPFGEPSPADVNQHDVGDCSACAVFASLAYLYPDFIKHIIKDNQDGTYTVSMFDSQGNPIEVCLSNKILCNASGTIGQVTGKNNVVTWSTILEKAFMKWETRFGIDAIEGIGTEFLAPLFTGVGDSYAFEPNALYTSELKQYVEYALNRGMLTIGGFNVAGLKCGELESVTAHAFTFMLSNNQSSVFAMRNPWGISSVDGVLQIPNDRTVVQAIDVRAVYPGAAEPFLRKEVLPYTPPAFKTRSTDIGVSKRLLKKAVSTTCTNELW